MKFKNHKVQKSIILIFILFLSFSASIFAQTETKNGLSDTEILFSREELDLTEDDYIPENKSGERKNLWNSVSSWCLNYEVLDRLDAGISLGSMGIGLEIKTPLTRWASLRLGVDWIPKITVPMYFGISTYSDGLPTGSFDKLASTLHEMTGVVIDDRVRMNSHGYMLNFKFLVDIYPFKKNRHWSITAGFYAGTSQVADSYNDLSEKPTLVGLNLYNRGYEYFNNLESLFDVPILSPELVEKIQERFRRYGRIGIPIGDFKDGSPYIMEPAPDGTVSAKAFVNHFKPYLGFGYNTKLDKAGLWNLGVDLGALFWGGAPDVIHHDYVNDRDINFTKDLVNIRGKVGRYMKLVHALPVYPVLSLRISYSIF